MEVRVCSRSSTLEDEDLVDALEERISEFDALLYSDCVQDSPTVGCSPQVLEGEAPGSSSFDEGAGALAREFACAYDAVCLDKTNACIATICALQLLVHCNDFCKANIFALQLLRSVVVSTGDESPNGTP